MAAARHRNLRSGHSHEDIDQCFGQLAAFISKHGRTANGPPDFRSLIQRWMDSTLQRPYEKTSYAVILDQCRDWYLAIVLDFRQLISFVFWIGVMGFKICFSSQQQAGVRSCTLVSQSS